MLEGERKVKGRKEGYEEKGRFGGERKVWSRKEERGERVCV